LPQASGCSLDDDPAQCVEAILTVDVPVAFGCHLLFGRESPRLPLLALGNSRLARVLKLLDPRPQRVTFSLQFIDPLGNVSRRPRFIRNVFFGLELVGGLRLATRSPSAQLADRGIMPAVGLLLTEEPFSDEPADEFLRVPAPTAKCLSIRPALIRDRTSATRRTSS
jgi:hypothetical protein